MNFRSEFTPKAFPIKLKHSDKLLLIGSCFTEQIGKKLSAHKFEILENPNGILFNPISISKALTGYTANRKYLEEELFYYNELWASRDHHSHFSNVDKETALQNINASQQVAHIFLKTADWILITLGSAFVYEWKDILPKNNFENVAANCHKIPTNKFNRRLTEPKEIINCLQAMMKAVQQINPKAKFIYTISPVRHLREGFVENNRSKATLIQAVHSLVNDKDIFYFPAYELVIDDLRDYRFFAEDFAHPNYTATNYVWEKFIATAIDEPSQKLMTAINEINAAKNHKPFNPTSEAHKTFLNTYLAKTNQLQKEYPYINFNEELEYFKS